LLNFYKSQGVIFAVFFIFLYLSWFSLKFAKNTHLKNSEKSLFMGISRKKGMYRKAGFDKDFVIIYNNV